MNAVVPLKYKRVILKVTGEVFAGPLNFGIDAKTVKAFAEEIKEVKEMGCDLAMVIGGGKKGGQVGGRRCGRRLCPSRR